ncbi:MAG: ATP synthase F1 subunit delta [Actinobacteria bacterium]|nr:ATP synthase F1 subunit delta [Actinomycetota bacterium]
MAEENVARVYARALFDAALEAHAVEPVGRDLGDFVAALAVSASLRDVLADPQIDTSAKQRILVEITRGGQPLVANTLQLMLDRGRFGLVAELREAYEALAVTEADLIKVEVTSAVELTAAAREKIVARVAAAAGRRVELAARVDPGIIGGLVLRVGDVIVDGSVQARIRQLRRRLATAELRGDVQ